MPAPRVTDPALPGRDRATAPARAALGVPLAVAALVALAEIAFAGRYGYHRAELYFLVAGDHLAWAYADQGPLTPLIAHAMDLLAPGSLTVLRIPSALMAAGTVLLAALTAFELGGRPRAQAIASSCTAVADRVPARRAGGGARRHRAAVAAAQRLAVGGAGCRGAAVVAVDRVAGGARLAAARRVVVDRRGRVGQLAAALGAAALPAPAGEPGARPGVDRRAGGAAAAAGAAALPAVRGGLGLPRGGLPRDRRQAVLPGRDVPGPARRRGDRGGRVAGAGVGPAARRPAVGRGRAERAWRTPPASTTTSAARRSRCAPARARPGHASGRDCATWGERRGRRSVADVRDAQPPAVRGVAPAAAGAAEGR